MPLQNFVDGAAPTIKAAWLNAIDAFYFTLFNSATTAAAARTALSVSATGTDLPLAGGTMTGPINETQATVASHATTADIWGSTASDVISWTGTATTTAFPNAPVAGARRLLVCSGACAFTSGANLIIEGLPTGVTVTMKANALVSVLALSTTQFKLTYSLSGSYTATGTGFSAATTATWYYCVNNGIVTIENPGLSGTSNTTAFTITGMPAELRPTATLNLGPLQGLDNTAYLSTIFGQIAAGGTISLFTVPLTGAWTASGTKGIIMGPITYLLKA